LRTWPLVDLSKGGQLLGLSGQLLGAMVGHLRSRVQRHLPCLFTCCVPQLNTLNPLLQGIESRPDSIACPLCRCTDVQVAANIFAIILCTCRQCATAFVIVPSAPLGVS
jgi:hypothetical protein